MCPASAPLIKERPSALPVETELKLRLPASRTQQFWKAAPISTLLGGRPSRLHLFSAYYDTPHLDLRKRGVALRLRRQGKRWVQTLKTQANAVGALQQRGELEVHVADGVLDLDWLKRSGLEEFSDKEFPTSTLGIVFTTEFDRNVAIVELAAGTSVEVCVDQGTINAGRKREPICEIELELKQGDVAPLFDLARELVTIPGVRIETTSKAQRGYRMAMRERTGPLKASAPSLPAGSNVDSIFKVLAFGCIDHLQRNEHGVLHSRDVEYLHQARVALRRLRSVFNVFSDAIPSNHFAEQLAWLRHTGQLLGEARDWDVFVTEFLPAACDRIKDNPALPDLMKNAARRRSAARRRVREALASADYSVQMLLLTQKLHEPKWEAERSIEQREIAALPPREFAGSILGRAHAKVIKQGAHMDQASITDFHKLRIRIKKLRYSSELLSPLFGHKNARKFLSKLMNMQQVLGALNDATNAASLADRLKPASDNLELMKIVAYLKGYADAKSRISLSRFNGAWKKFEAAQVFW